MQWPFKFQQTNTESEKNDSTLYPYRNQKENKIRPRTKSIQYVRIWGRQKMRLTLTEPERTNGSQPSSPSAGVRPRVTCPIWLSAELVSIRSRLACSLKLTDWPIRGAGYMLRLTLGRVWQYYGSRLAESGLSAG